MIVAPNLCDLFESACFVTVLYSQLLDGLS